MPALDQVSSHDDTLRVIKAEQTRRCPSDGCQWHDRRRSPAEMIRPLIGARMKEARDKAGLRVERGNVRSLAMVTRIACVRKVIEPCRATMLRSDNVIWLVWDKRDVVGQSTILTAVRRTLGH
ncbi:MAG TPA: hypothetical protein VF725_05805 [Ktedonobacterales bacterium]